MSNIGAARKVNGHLLNSLVFEKRDKKISDPHEVKQVCKESRVAQNLLIRWSKEPRVVLGILSFDCLLTLGSYFSLMLFFEKFFAVYAEYQGWTTKKNTLALFLMYSVKKLHGHHLFMSLDFLSKEGMKAIL